MSYGIDYHIPTNINRNAITSEFEAFFERSLLKDISNITGSEVNKVKTKVRTTYDKYFSMKVPHTQRKIISGLSKRDDIILLKQDKWRGVAVMDVLKYTEKCLEMLLTKQFTVFENDPTKPQK